MAFNPVGMASGLVGAVLPIGAAAAGIGKNKTNITNFGNTSQYNPNAFRYGGREGAADETAGRFAGLAAGAQGRGATQANYGRANDWEQQGLAARAEQGQMAGLMHGRATGAIPSIAGQQAALDMQRATAAQSSAAAGARGAGGLALAQQNAAGNTATMQSAISNNAQVNAANERMQAEQAAFGAYSGMRGGDQAAQGISSQQAQYQAQLDAQQRAQNDNFSMGLYGQEAGVRAAQLTGGMNQQNTLANSFGQAQGQNLEKGQANANLQMKYYDQFGKGLTGAMGGAMGPSAPPANAPPPTGSDDKMKFGMSPLSMLGLGGGGGGAGSGPAAASFDKLNGDGSMNVMGSLKAHSDFGTQYGRDPTGGMQGGGLLSDDKAKLRAVYLQGIADAGSEDRAYPGLAANETLHHSRDGARISADFAGARASGEAMTTRGKAAQEYASAAGMYGGKFSPIDLTPLGQGSNVVNLGRGLAAQHLGVGVDEGSPRQQPAPSDPSYDEERRIAEKYGGADSIRRAPGADADPVTEQFARGLAPIRFQYKGGMGPPGEQTGVRAQQAETQPVTASMIRRRPDGMREIDPAMGLGTALAGVGHLAQKQKRQEAQLNDLLSFVARREGY